MPEWWEGASVDAEGLIHGVSGGGRQRRERRTRINGVAIIGRTGGREDTLSEPNAGIISSMMSSEPGTALTTEQVMSDSDRFWLLKQERANVFIGYVRVKADNKEVKHTFLKQEFNNTDWKKGVVKAVIETNLFRRSEIKYWHAEEPDLKTALRYFDFQNVRTGLYALETHSQPRSVSEPDRPFRTEVI